MSSISNACRSEVTNGASCCMNLLLTDTRYPLLTWKTKKEKKKKKLTFLLSLENVRRPIVNKSHPANLNTNWIKIQSLFVTKNSIPDFLPPSLTPPPPLRRLWCFSINFNGKFWKILSSRGVSPVADRHCCGYRTKKIVLFDRLFRKKKEKNYRFLPPFISANIFRRSFSSRFFFFLFNPLKSVNTFRVDGDNCLPDSRVRDARFPRSIKRNGQSKVRDGQREMDSATTMETTRGAYNQDMHLPCIQFVTISWRMIRVRAVR